MPRPGKPPLGMPGPAAVGLVLTARSPETHGFLTAGSPSA